jgi:hypothetical protein
MIEERLRIIRDLERAIRVWSLVLDDAQQSVNKSPALQAIIAACNTSTLAAKARIDELERED